MMTKVKSMMVIGTMILGTMTSFGNTKGNVNVHPDKNNKARVECNLRHIHDSRCGGNAVIDRNKVYPGMSEKTRKHIIKGNHNFNHHDVCTKCNMSRTEIRHIERSMITTSSPSHSHFGNQQQVQKSHFH